ncbi:Multisubstrate pseudouridine synthase 7 [Candida viswanathii]|uniref:Multisubstrate pseudouridine synthase 7 n=1 Tax=Candida viswanathii TaxID=5486 RepID=A0A367YPE9_9ASCO|nr:Multisubstrate pseudouridine synthase 7 [Candida viswanathii]
MIRQTIRRVFGIMTETLKRTTSSELLDVPAKKPKLVPMGISEEKAGITQFINPNVVGFSGSLKTLYSDFQVNEIEPNGNVVHLTDMGIDVGPTKKELRMQERAKFREEIAGKTEEEIAEIKAKRWEEKEEEKKVDSEESKKYNVPDEDREELLKYVTPAELSQIEALFTSGGNMETETTFDDKQQRTELHQLVRRVFDGKLETVTSPENKFRIAIGTKRSRKPRQQQESMHHVDENGVVNYGLGTYKPYLHFTLYKQNRDTMEVANNMAKLLRVNNRFINYAGTKDRRGATCQKFSIHNGKVLRVNGLNKLTKHGFTLGSFSYEDFPLKLGDSNGNQFTIVIRDAQTVDGKGDVEATVSSCFESLKKNGFINYFGMQRFGSFSVSTHEYGKLLLTLNWEEFIEVLLSEQDAVAPASAEARRIWAETRDPEQALAALPHYFVAETAILKTLRHETQNADKKYSKNAYLKSIQAIPRNLRMMYVHAYQAYVWNRVASKRIELYGMNLVEGDLVFEDSQQVLDEDVAYVNDAKVKALTKEDIESGKYTIFDVILSSAGYKIQYPANETLRSVYVETMAKDGLDPFKMARNIKEFSMTGTYRKLMAQAKNLSYDIVKYSDDEKPLIRTDLELLQIKQETNEDVPRLIPNEEGGDKLAVVLQMQLGVSSYATMALREFMRIDTSRYREGLCK